VPPGGRVRALLAKGAGLLQLLPEQPALVRVPPPGEKGSPMKATIWAPDFVMPSGFCFNCGAPPTTAVTVYNEAGLGTTQTRGLLGAAVSAARDAATANGGWPVSYCDACAAQAKPCVWEDLPAFMVRWKMRPGQTVVGRAFRVLNAGKDLLRGNKQFVRIQFTNPRVLGEIKTLNADLRIT
jgi:hypothetical protein